VAPITAPADTVPAPLDPIENVDNSPVLPALLGILLALPFVYLAIQSVKNRRTKDDGKGKKKCFNIKKLLDDKLEELTDLKSRIKDKAEDSMRGVLREAVQGTQAGEALILIEKVEKEYARLKKLYEECITDVEGRVFKGVLIHESLKDKSYLDNIQIDKTYKEKDWTLHDISVKEDKINEFSKYLSSGPWYVHFWEEGKDDIRIVFKDKIFNIKSSDKSTWAEAVAYAKSIGIPEEQLDFRIEEKK